VSGDWERICPVDDVHPERPVGRVVGDSGQDRDRVCVVERPDGSHVAMLDRCPHRDIALSGGVVRDGTLVCPGHFWRFDLVTGERTDLPTQVMTLYPTRVVDGWVEAQLPAPVPHLSMREWLLAEARRRTSADEMS
jgi:nitrite reductase/ring-hydroxylating ferredoxin subunit